MGASNKQKLLQVMPLIVLDIGLPTSDVFSDIIGIITLYQAGLAPYATRLLMPLILNVVFTTFAWWRMDSPQEKRFTWALLLMQLWPQYRAVKIILKILKEDQTYIEDKFILERDVSILEPFIESVPTVWIIVMLLLDVFNRKGQAAIAGEREEDYNKVFIQLALSFISSSIGIAKFLKVGPCKIFPVGGSVAGYITGRYLVLLCAIASSIIAKALLLTTSVFVWSGLIQTLFGYERESHSEGRIYFLGVHILPHFLWSLVLAWMALRNIKSLWITLRTYPQIFLVGVFTPFVFGPKQLYCCSTPEIEVGRIAFSKQGTIVNLIITFVGSAITLGPSLFSIIAELVDPAKGDGEGWGWVFIMIFHIHSIPAIVLLGIVLTLVIFLLKSPQCCCRPRYEECFAMKYHYIYVRKDNQEAFEFGEISQ